MDAKKILLSGASTDAKLSALAILLSRELPDLKATVDNVQKQVGPRGEQGPKGDPGKDGVNGKDGKDGKDGVNGKDGVDGKDGSDGISIISTNIDFDGSLVIKFSDGRVVNVGEVVGEKGERGAAGMSGKDGEAFANLDGGFPGSVYGGISPIDAGGI